MQGKEYFQNRKIADKLSLVVKVVFVILAINNILFAALMIAFGHPVFLIIPVLGVIVMPILGQQMVKALTENILEPLDQIENAAEAMSQGNLEIDVTYESEDELGKLAQSFRKTASSLKEVVEDMQKNKDALGIDGVFASTSLKSGEDWRWQTHLANLPVYQEFKANNVDLTSDETKTLKFDYADNFKNIFDLYINNSTVDSSKLGTKTVNDSMAEFALEKCAMVQNGNWAWGQISEVKGNKVKAENVKYLPIYTGVDGEESQGLCIGTENFFCVNSQASASEQKAAKDFIYWLYSSKTGKDYVTNKLGFIAPFDTFEDNEKPTDPLAKEVLLWMNKDGINTVPWNFTLFPSQTFKDDFGAALLQYAQGTKTFDEVKELVVNEWASESAAIE